MGYEEPPEPLPHPLSPTTGRPTTAERQPGAGRHAAARDPAGTGTWQRLIAGLGALTLLAICGLSSFLIARDEREGRAAGGIKAAVTPTALPRDIDSRAVDPEPLTPAEVFPNREIVIDAREPPYRVLKTRADQDCRTAVTGDLGRLLTELGCDQVVRGTLRSPTGGYLVTAGVFNLADVTGADRAHREIKSMVDGKRGRFHGMAAGAGTEPVVLAPAQIGWHTRGHFLIYCVIARADGKEIDGADPFTQQILYDMIELHLRGQVLGRRAATPVDRSTHAGSAIGANQDAGVNRSRRVTSARRANSAGSSG